MLNSERKFWNICLLFCAAAAALAVALAFLDINQTYFFTPIEVESEFNISENYVSNFCIDILESEHLADNRYKINIDGWEYIDGIGSEGQNIYVNFKSDFQDVTFTTEAYDRELSKVFTAIEYNIDMDAGFRVKLELEKRSGEGVPEDFDVYLIAEQGEIVVKTLVAQMTLLDI